MNRVKVPAERTNSCLVVKATGPERLDQQVIRRSSVCNDIKLTKYDKINDHSLCVLPL